MAILNNDATIFEDEQKLFDFLENLPVETVLLVDPQNTCYYSESGFDGYVITYDHVDFSSVLVISSL